MKRRVFAEIRIVAGSIKRAASFPLVLSPCIVILSASEGSHGFAGFS
jgi:hypothetical protein